jgi:hypothetical protein
MLEKVTFPACLSLVKDFKTFDNDDEGTNELLKSLCDFLSVCLTHFDWAFDAIVVGDRCKSNILSNLI